MYALLETHDTVFGDTMPYLRDGVCHLFVLRPPSIAHYVSTDFVRWDERPLAVSPGGAGEPDDGGCWTGSVVEHHGRFWLFYTGNQNVCLATSHDLDHWTKVADNPVLVGDGTTYARTYFRDPYVFYHEAEGRWWMLFGSRTPGAPTARSGCVGLATSPDLRRWTLRAPLWAPAIGPHADCPHLLRHETRWYLFYLQRHTRYRIANTAFGPFRRPVARDLLSPLAAAGSRPVFDGRRWITFPFVMRRRDDDDFGDWHYGGPLAIPRGLRFHADGSVTEYALEEIVHTARCLPADDGGPLRNARPLTGRWHLIGNDGAQCLADDGGILLLREGPYDCYVEATIHFGARDMDAHLLIGVGEDLCRGYKLALHPSVGVVSLRSISEVDVDPVIEARAIALDASKPVRLQVFVRGTILEAFIDDRISLTARLYRRHGGRLAFEFRDAPGSVTGIRITSLLEAPV